MAAWSRIEILGPAPWPVGLIDALPRYAPIPLRIMITPQRHAQSIVAGLRGHPEVVIWASDPSAIEASMLIAAGASAYVTELKDLVTAVRAVSSGEAWLAPVAATAVCRLARITLDPGLDSLAAAARAAAGGQPWPLACRSTGLAQTRSLLTQLRRQL
jgi:DNA-binding NarL/FixJ family response regulator